MNGTKYISIVLKYFFFLSIYHLEHVVHGNLVKLLLNMWKYFHSAQESSTMTETRLSKKVVEQDDTGI